MAPTWIKYTNRPTAMCESCGLKKRKVLFVCDCSFHICGDCKEQRDSAQADWLHVDLDKHPYGCRNPAPNDANTTAAPASSRKTRDTQSAVQTGKVVTPAKLASNKPATQQDRNSQSKAMTEVSLAHNPPLAGTATGSAARSKIWPKTSRSGALSGPQRNSLFNDEGDRERVPVIDSTDADPDGESDPSNSSEGSADAGSTLENDRAMSSIDVKAKGEAEDTGKSAATEIVVSRLRTKELMLSKYPNPHLTNPIKEQIPKLSELWKLPRAERERYHRMYSAPFANLGPSPSYLTRPHEYPVEATLSSAGPLKPWHKIQKQKVSFGKWTDRNNLGTNPVQILSEDGDVIATLTPIPGSNIRWCRYGDNAQNYFLYRESKCSGRIGTADTSYSLVSRQVLALIEMTPGAWRNNLPEPHQETEVPHLLLKKHPVHLIRHPSKEEVDCAIENAETAQGFYSPNIPTPDASGGHAQRSRKESSCGTAVLKAVELRMQSLTKEQQARVWNDIQDYALEAIQKELENQHAGDMETPRFQKEQKDEQRLEDSLARAENVWEESEVLAQDFTSNSEVRRMAQVLTQAMLQTNPITLPHPTTPKMPPSGFRSFGQPSTPMIAPAPTEQFLEAAEKRRRSSQSPSAQPAKKSRIGLTETLNRPTEMAAETTTRISTERQANEWIGFDPFASTAPPTHAPRSSQTTQQLASHGGSRQRIYTPRRPAGVHSISNSSEADQGGNNEQRAASVHSSRWTVHTTDDRKWKPYDPTKGKKK